MIFQNYHWNYYWRNMENRLRKSAKNVPEPPRSSRHADSEDDLSTFSKRKREQILSAAMELFLTEGYAATTMNRVASMSGVTKQTIYSHFHDKEGLFVAIIEQVTIKHMHDQFKGRTLEGEPEQVLRSLAKIFIDRQKDEQYLYLIRTVIAESARFPELARLFVRTVIKRGIQMLSQYFDNHPELEIRDSQATARIFCGSFISYIISQEILHGKEIIQFDVERLVDQLIAQILRC